MTTRRVVTAINAQGKSYFVKDGPTPGHFDAGIFQSDELWVDDPAHPDPNVSKDPVDAPPHKLGPPPGGSTVRFFTFPPEGAKPTMNREQIIESLKNWDSGDAMEENDPGMHTTATIDYGIVLSGEIDLELDEGEVHLRAGDIVIQRATRHAWRNRSEKPCTMAFILISSPNYRPN